MHTIARRGTVTLLLLLSAACDSHTPTSPPGTGQLPLDPAPPPPPPPPPPYQPPSTQFPPPSGPSRTFSFDHELAYPSGNDYTKESRFVLYDNGAFALRFPSAEFRGGYAETNGVISFAWEGWSPMGPWGATGTIQGDTLTVQYNLIMQLTDFEDAAYVLRP